MYKVELLLEARLQLRDIAMYHSLKKRHKSKENITDRILDTIEKLEEFPNMGMKPFSEMAEEVGYRMLVIDEYFCFYNISDQTVYVNLIVHGSTDYIKSLLNSTTI